jgi:pyruvate,water dikinase
MFYLHDFPYIDEPMSHYGSKATNLGKLLSAGYRVPNGAVFSPSDSLSKMTPERQDFMLANISSMVGRKPKSNLYAVRSSGLAEDGEDSSYAGQHDTYLNVPHGDILRRIHDCRKSGSKAEAYREAKGETDQGIAVLVQMMVPSWMSGVTFTSDPFNMELGTSVIEYTMGLGDRLVAGEVDPTGSYEVDNPSGKFTPSILDDGKLLRAMVNVQQQCQSIAALFGTPMDIEWAIDNDFRLWILQARPLTTGGRKWNYPELKGRSVVKGRAEGIARWAEGDAENMKFDEGNILLAIMTNPHMVPLMMKASGIATKIGGRTCHAAIVSRELNKPCVVGVGNLNILQSNTQVVLDATAGVVII